ncbi:MAG: CobW family GTP-binding protein [Desulfomonilaceae bacterium]
MSKEGTDVCLISGFLGSGKTTFLNHMLKEVPSDIKLLVLMNEFGEESVDGALVEDPELEMLEISKGSIFCACVKGDFIKALYQIAFVIKPEVLVIEASGVANPTDIGRDLFNPMFKGMFRSLDKVCIIDAENFLEQYEIFTALEKQIDAADKFVINKTDLVNQSIVDQIKKVILDQNSKSTFVETSFCNVSLNDLLTLSIAGSSNPSPDFDRVENLLNDEALDKLIDSILVDEAAQISPPDKLISVTFRWHGGSVDDFIEIADNVPSDVIRAKGFVFGNNQAYVYSHVGHKYTVEPFEGARLVDRSANRVVFIRKEFKEDDIRSMFLERGLKLK